MCPEIVAQSPPGLNPGPWNFHTTPLPPHLLGARKSSAASDLAQILELLIEAERDGCRHAIRSCRLALRRLGYDVSIHVEWTAAHDPDDLAQDFEAFVSSHERRDYSEALRLQRRLYRSGVSILVLAAGRLEGVVA